MAWFATATDSAGEKGKGCQNVRRRNGPMNGSNFSYTFARREHRRLRKQEGWTSLRNGVAACQHAGPNRCDSMSEMGYYDSYTEKPQEAAALGWENC